jgi:hypothetical protein
VSVWADLVQFSPSTERLIGTGINVGEPTDADGIDYWQREKLERATDKFLASLAQHHRLADVRASTIRR